MNQTQLDIYFKDTIQPLWKELNEQSKEIIKTLIAEMKNIHSSKIESSVIEEEHFLETDKRQWDIAIKTLYSYESDIPEQYRDSNKKTYNYLKKLPLIYSCVEDKELGSYLSKKKEYLVSIAREKALIDEKISSVSLEEFYSNLYNESEGK